MRQQQPANLRSAVAVAAVLVVLLTTIVLLYNGRSPPSPRVLDLSRLSIDRYRYQLHFNSRHGFYFLTEVGTNGTQFTGPHDAVWFNDQGVMMEPETAFAADQMKKAIAKRGACDVIDVGANFGFFSMLAMSLGCRVFLFEPEKRNFDLAMLNFHINGFTNYVAFNNPAGPGTVVPFDGWSSANSMSNIESQLQTVPISVVTQYTRTIDWFKLDVEGFENEVVKSIPDNMHIGSMNIEITWYLHKYLEYDATYKMLHKRFRSIVDPDRPEKGNIQDLVAFKDELDATICNKEKQHFCQFNILCTA